MAIELFLIPMELVNIPGRGAGYFAKYTRDPAIVRTGTIRYSRTDSAVVMIEAPQAYLNSVASQSDVTRLATTGNIDNTLNTGQANAAKSVFEAAFIPGQFINAGDTRRQVIRGVVGMFLFSQRLEGRFGEGWRARAVARGITLDSTWQQFPAALQNEFIEIRDDHGWTNTDLGVTNTSTLREILRAVSDRFEATPILFAGLEV